MELLKFSKGNAKLIGIPSLSLLAGHSCPQANLCKAKVNLVTRKLEDGPEQVYRCFSASQEVLFKETFNQRKHNFDLLRNLKTADEMAALIQASLPNPKKKIIRLHVSGDMFNEQYFLAWIKIANDNPNLLFYTYTKSLALWVKNKNIIPTNLKLTASKGGRQDNLIDEHNLKYVQVVSTPEEAEQLGLPLDKDDSNAYMHDKSFALLIHGTQKAGSDMSKAKSALRQRGITGYQRTSKTPNKFKKLAA
jgi:hypothetical protein